MTAMSRTKVMEACAQTVVFGKMPHPSLDQRLTQDKNPPAKLLPFWQVFDRGLHRLPNLPNRASCASIWDPAPGDPVPLA